MHSINALPVSRVEILYANIKLLIYILNLIYNNLTKPMTSNYINILQNLKFI